MLWLPAALPAQYLSVVAAHNRPVKRAFYGKAKDPPMRPVPMTVIWRGRALCQFQFSATARIVG